MVRQPRVHELQPDVRRHRRGPRGATARRQARRPRSRWPRTAASVIEIAREGGAGRWSTAAATTAASPPTRRCASPGPAAGDAKMKTSADPTGTRCWACSTTAPAARRRGAPWLTCEENFNYYFARRRRRSARAATLQALRHRRHGLAMPGASHSTASTSTRSRTSPTASAGSSRSIPTIRQATPVKRTALGRFKHEGADHAVAKDGRVVVYMRRRRAHRVRLQVRDREALRTRTTAPPTATCSTRARSTSRGSTTTARCAWLPLVHGQGPLTAENGFTSQADVRDRRPARRRPAAARRPWTGPRTSRPTRSPAASMSC